MNKISPVPHRLPADPAPAIGRAPRGLRLLVTSALALLSSLPAVFMATTATAATVAAVPDSSDRGRVEVVYEQPDRFADVGFGSFERERNLRQLKRHLQGLASSLPAGQTLKLEITDVDLAGWVEPVSDRQIRIVRGGADWPRIELRYALQADGRVLKSGSARLADMNYTWRPRGVDHSMGELGYEKRMVDDWFAQTFGSRPH